MQENMLFYAEALKQNKPQFVLIDERKLLYSWIPENQEWIDLVITPISLELELKKHAIIQNEDIFLAVAVEQLMNETNAKNLTTRFFEDFEEAEKWLLKK
jgi:hypothetical protein